MCGVPIHVLYFSDSLPEAPAIQSFPRTARLTVAALLLAAAAILLSACGRPDGSLSVRMTYPSASTSASDAESSSVLPDASMLPGPASASYPTAPSNRILIRVLGPGFDPIEAWFDRSAGRGVIGGIPPGARISVEVDEYDNSATLRGTDAPLLGRGWTRGIALSPGETKTVDVAMYAKGTIVTVCGAQASGGQGTPGDSGDGGLDNAARIGNPSAVKSGPDDSIYISSSKYGKVKRIDRYGYISHFAGNGSSGAVTVGAAASTAPVGYASDIDIDPSGNLYLFTYWNQIVKISGGAISEVVYDNGAANPMARFDLAVVADGLIYFVNYLDPRIFRIVESVKSDYVMDGSPYDMTEPFDRLHYPISGPSSITYMGKSNSLIFADSINDRIMEFNLLDLGIRYFVAGITGSNSFSEGIAPLSMVPVRPRVLDYNPITGKIFFVEGEGNRVLYITLDNVVRTFAGTGSPGFSGDGGPATAAQLYDPRGVTVDSRGNAYIADCGNHAIRMVVGGALP